MDQSRMQSNNDIQTRPNLGCDNESINNRENNQNYFSRNIIKKILLGTAFIAAGTYFVRKYTIVLLRIRADPC